MTKREEIEVAMQFLKDKLNLCNAYIEVEDAPVWEELCHDKTIRSVKLTYKDGNFVCFTSSTDSSSGFYIYTIKETVVPYTLTLENYFYPRAKRMLDGAINRVIQIKQQELAAKLKEELTNEIYAPLLVEVKTDTRNIEI